MVGILGELAELVVVETVGLVIILDLLEPLIQAGEVEDRETLAGTAGTAEQVALVL